MEIIPAKFHYNVQSRSGCNANQYMCVFLAVESFLIVSPTKWLRILINVDDHHQDLSINPIFITRL